LRFYSVDRGFIINKGPSRLLENGVVVRKLDNDRVATGIDKVDGLIQGGFLSGRTYLVTGAPGTGKTIFALQFLMAGLAEGEKGLYVCVNERPEDVLEIGRSLGWPVEKAAAEGRIEFLDMAPFFSRSAVVNHNKYDRRRSDINIRKFLVDLSKHARTASAKRLVIDSINLILPGARETRAALAGRELVISVEQYLSCTTLFTLDYWQAAGDDELHPIESSVSGVINLALDASVVGCERRLAIKKMRAMAVKPTVQAFGIESPAGILLLPELGAALPGLGDNGAIRTLPTEDPLIRGKQNKGPILLKD
jgi:circadian clock protein KaiC